MLFQCSDLCAGAVALGALDLRSDDAGRPVREPEVDGDHQRVFGELREDEQRQQQHTRGAQVRRERAPGDSGPVTQLRPEAVLIGAGGAVCKHNQTASNLVLEEVKQTDQLEWITWRRSVSVCDILFFE